MSANNNPFIAKWSAQGHTLCLGHWQITYKQQTLVLPAERVDKDMDTYGNFSWLYPDDDVYVEGTPINQWIINNVDWLLETFEQHLIPTDQQHFEWFYQAVNSADWRCSSCGGCL